MGVDAVKVAVVVDQFGRLFLPHPGHTGQVVGRIPAQGGVDHVVRRVHPGALAHSRFVVGLQLGHTPGVGVEHPDVGILHQLVGVAVTGDHPGLLATVTGLGGKRGQHVVSLVAHHFHHPHAERRHQLAHQTHLLHEDVGSFVALGLVGLNLLMAERGFGAVKGHHHPIRAVVTNEIHQH